MAPIWGYIKWTFIRTAGVIKIYLHILPYEIYRLHNVANFWIQMCVWYLKLKRSQGNSKEHYYNCYSELFNRVNIIKLKSRKMPVAYSNLYE